MSQKYCLPENLKARSAGQNIVARRFLYGLSVIAAATTAKAQSGNLWNQPAGGSWENAANWSLGTVPEGQPAVFSIPAANPYVVSVSAQQHPVDLDVTNNNVTINASAGTALTIVRSLNISASAGALSSLVFNGTSSNGTDGSVLIVDNGGEGNAVGTIGGAGSTYFTLNDTSFTNVGDPFQLGRNSTLSVNNSIFNAGVSIGGLANFSASSAFPENAIYNIAFGVSASEQPANLNVSNGSVFTLLGNGIVVGNNILGS